MAGGLRIGELAKRAGVGVETVRYYERRGLVARPARSSGAFRRYDENAVRRIRFIRRVQELGFTLREIGDLLDLRLEPGADCGSMRQRAEAKLADIDRKGHDLQRMRDALVGLIEQCEGSGPIERGCPILDRMEGAPVRDASSRARCSVASEHSTRRSIMAQKRQIELFSAGCPACDEALDTIRQIACPSCEVTVRDMNDPAVADRARQLGLRRVPAVVIDGQLAECCQDGVGGVDEATLRRAGVGQPLG